MLEGAKSHEGRRYAVHKPEEGGGATVVVLAAEESSLEETVECTLLCDLLARSAGTSAVVFEGRGLRWDGYRTEGDRPAGEDAEDLLRVMRSEGLLGPRSEDTERLCDHAGARFVVLASSTAVRAALHLLRSLSVGLLILNSPYLLRHASNEREPEDSSPELGGTYTFVFAGPLADKAPTLPEDLAPLSEPENVFLWLLDASEASSYSCWTPKGNARIETTVDGVTMTMTFGRRCLVRSLTDLVLWYHSSIHVLDAYLSYAGRERTGPTKPAKPAKPAALLRAHVRYASPHAGDAFMSLALQAIVSAAREAPRGGGYYA